VGTYTIAEAASRSGFRPSTLRYYEDLGLVAPVERTGAGYRVYDDTSLGRLAFIARAKQLGCTLDEISSLVRAWDGQRCEPVQTQLRALVEAKRDEARARIDDLVALVGQLHEAAVTLADHTPDGPCDDSCGCVAPAPDAADGPRVPARTPVGLTRKPRPTSEIAATVDDGRIACTLDTGVLPGRWADWRVALAPVVARTTVDGGLRLTFAPGVALGALAELIAAERACCAFLRFALTVDERGAALEVTAPPEAAPVVDELFGGRR